jgi:hypothetical protein
VADKVLVDLESYVVNDPDIATLKQAVDFIYRAVEIVLYSYEPELNCLSFYSIEHVPESIAGEYLNFVFYGQCGLMVE